MKYNLSPETVERPELKGFLSTVLSSLLSLRIETKRLKKTSPDYASIDSVLGLELLADFSSTAMRFAADHIPVANDVTGPACMPSRSETLAIPISLIPRLQTGHQSSGERPA